MAHTRVMRRLHGPHHLFASIILIDLYPPEIKKLYVMFPLGTAQSRVCVFDQYFQVMQYRMRQLVVGLFCKAAHQVTQCDLQLLAREIFATTSCTLLKIIHAFTCIAGRRLLPVLFNPRTPNKAPAPLSISQKAPGNGTGATCQPISSNPA